MIGAVIIFIAGWTIRKIWPNGLLFLLIFAALSTAIGLAGRRDTAKYYDEAFKLDFQTIALAFGTTLIFHRIIYLMAYGLSKLFSKQRKYLDQVEKQADENNAPNN